MARLHKLLVRKPSNGSTSQTTSAPRKPWKRESKKVEVTVVEKPKKATKVNKRERSGFPPPFYVSAEELYNILEAWVKDGMMVLPECKREPIEEEKRGALYCRYHRSDHHTMDCYALRNTFHEKVAMGDFVIKNRKHIDQRMHKPEVVMTFFISCEGPMEEEVGSATSSSTTPMPLQDEEMVLKIQQDDKVHTFLEGMGLKSLARREAA